MTNTDESIDFKQVEKEFAAAVAHDTKYQRENDAKFRAIHQKVGSYEEFRDIVKASHLTPLEKKDRFDVDKPKRSTWNALASKKPAGSHVFPAADAEPVVSETPRTAQEFNRSWRQLKTPEAKHRYLLNVGAERLRNIFKFEVGFGLLGDMLIVMSQAFQGGDDGPIVVDVLDALSTTNRFALNCQFLSTSEKEKISSLFSKIEESFPGERLNVLRRLYLQNTN
ncbi:coiled-coil domain-containing protein 103-like [Oscarella lobularis]|uniref:coiled-coil domain-containing protein 103-like n=1 Tax=Oscarella lobularis TaxID=121494 RepID=UPI003313B590